MSDNILTQERLKELLSYDPETGIFTRIKQVSSNAIIGDVAGTGHCSGYRRIQFYGKKFREHRLAWLYMTGAFPPDDIDHINRDRADNRFTNLRAATRNENAHNRVKHLTNTSGFKGVSYHKASKKWSAQIWSNNVRKYLGVFLTPEEASAAYLAAERIYHPTCPTI